MAFTGRNTPATEDGSGGGNREGEGSAPVGQELDEGQQRFLRLAQQAYSQSTSFIDTNYRTLWAENIAHFQSRHAPGSKYLKDTYKFRSRIFRPKTRSAIRQNEAAVAAAFFSNMDVVSIEPRDPTDRDQAAGAELNQSLLQYRLTESIPWFLICVGGFQDAMVQGIVASFQRWKRKTKEVRFREFLTGEEGEQILDGETGEPLYDIVTETEVLEDQPEIVLVPIENIRFSPGAQWYDVVGTSPYLIIMWPMYVKDVKERMDREEDGGLRKWHKLTDGQLRSALSPAFDSTRQARAGTAKDPVQEAAEGAPKPLSEYDIIWVHENFVEVRGQDYQYYTLGTEYMLTDPEPRENVYWHAEKERPVVVGSAVIETHRPIPSAVVDLGKPVQKEMNEIANQRLDNVKLVLNKRHKVKRGRQVDVRSILRNVPGSVTFVTEADDWETESYDDITASAYQEQDRLNVDFDELIGVFSPGTIQTNRRLNETVGGMAMLRGGANSLVEYVIRTFSETWVEKVVKQVVRMEQAYETDEVVLSLAGRNAQLFERYGVSQVTDSLLNQALTTVVHVGMGATDPVLKLDRLLRALETLSTLSENSPPGADLAEISKEVWSKLGYKDGSRFMVDPNDPITSMYEGLLQQAGQIIQELQAQLESEEQRHQVRLITTDMKEQGDDRRALLKARTDLLMKRMDLLNPVVGERIRGRDGGGTSS